MLSFDLSPEQQALQENVARFTRDRIVPNAAITISAKPTGVIVPGLTTSGLPDGAVSPASSVSGVVSRVPVYSNAHRSIGEVAESRTVTVVGPSSASSTCHREIAPAPV